MHCFSGSLFFLVFHLALKGVFPLVGLSQMCSAVLGSPKEVMGERRACAASSLFPATGTDSGRPVKRHDWNTPFTQISWGAYKGRIFHFLNISNLGFHQPFLKCDSSGLDRGRREMITLLLMRKMWRRMTTGAQVKWFWLSDLVNSTSDSSALSCRRLGPPDLSALRMYSTASTR